MEKVVETKELCKFYRNASGNRYLKAVDEVSLEIEKGEIFGLLGPNGSGKTTIIKLLLGLIHPTAGTMTVLGRDPRHVPSKKRIGYLPEHPYFYEFLTPEEILRFYGSLSDVSGTLLDRRIRSLIDRLGLERFRKTRIRNFSKGMLQRLGLAVSLINDPELLLLDEPTLGLDPIGTSEVQDLLRELNEQGKTVFLSSHLLSQVEDCCKRVAIIYRGRLIKSGNLENLLERKDEMKFTVKLNDPRQAEDLGRRVQELGLELSEVSAGRDSLKDFFMALIKGEKR